MTAGRRTGGDPVAEAWSGPGRGAPPRPVAGRPCPLGAGGTRKRSAVYSRNKPGRAGHPAWAARPAGGTGAAEEIMTTAEMSRREGEARGEARGVKKGEV